MPSTIHITVSNSGTYPWKIAFVALVGKLKAKSAVTSSFKGNGSLEFRMLERLRWVFLKSLT